MCFLPESIECHRLLSRWLARVYATNGVSQFDHQSIQSATAFNMGYQAGNFLLRKHHGQSAALLRAERINHGQFDVEYLLVKKENR
jgi:hypothetical protein